MRRERPECGANAEDTPVLAVKYRHWRVVVFAGALGFVVTLLAVEIVDAYAHVADARCRSPWRSSPARCSACRVAGAISAWHVRRRLARAEPAARRRAQQHDSGPVHVRCAEPPGGLERALPGHVQHRSACASGAAAPSATCSMRASPPARSRSIRPATTPNCARRSSKARPSRSTSNWPTAASSPWSISRSKAAAGWRRTRTSPSASAPSANSSRPARSSIPSSRTCRRRSSSRIAPSLRYLLINRAAEKYLGVDRDDAARQDARPKSCRRPAPKRSRRRTAN